MALTKVRNLMIDGAPRNVRDYGAVGDGVTDDVVAIQTAIDDREGVVFFPPGEYLCKSRIELRHNTILRGSGGYGHPDANASRIIGQHTEEAILFSNRTLQARVEDLTLIGDETITPKTAIAHGRGTAASSGTSYYSNLITQGHFSVAVVYVIASEENVFENCRFGLDGGGATRIFYTNNADQLSVASYVGSSNIASNVRKCFFDFREPGAPGTTFGARPFAIEMDYGQTTSEWVFENCYSSLPEGGFFVGIQCETTSIGRGPVTFRNNGVEPSNTQLGVLEVPAGLFYISSTGTKAINNLILVENRLSQNTGNAIETSGKPILDGMYYRSSANSEAISNHLNIQAYKIKNSYIKTRGTVTITDPIKHAKNIIIKDDAGGLRSQLCTAWLNMDGTGTPAIQESFNISSITDNGVGDYSVNFDGDLNARYSVSGLASVTTNDTQIGLCANSHTTINSRIHTFNTSSGATVDCAYITLQFFGELET
jgi:hypothetical protein